MVRCATFRPQRVARAHHQGVPTLRALPLSNRVYDEPSAAEGRVLAIETQSSAVGSNADAVRAAAGDVAAFERLYRDHAARVHGLARRMVGAEEADDLTQEVFVRAWEKLGTFRGEALFGTWLHRLAVNALLGHRKAQGRSRQRFEYDEEAVGAAASPPADAGVSVDLEAALDRLPQGARRVFVLHDVEGYLHEDIARMLGVSIGTSKSQLHRARMLLREWLAR